MAYWLCGVSVIYRNENITLLLLMVCFWDQLAFTNLFSVAELTLLFLLSYYPFFYFIFIFLLDRITAQLKHGILFWHPHISICHPNSMNRHVITVWCKTVTGVHLNSRVGNCKKNCQNWEPFTFDGGGGGKNCVNWL